MTRVPFRSAKPQGDPRETLGGGKKATGAYTPSGLRSNAAQTPMKEKGNSPSQAHSGNFRSAKLQGSAQEDRLDNHLDDAQEKTVPRKGGKSVNRLQGAIGRRLSGN